MNSHCAHPRNLAVSHRCMPLLDPLSIQLHARALKETEGFLAGLLCHIEMRAFHDCLAITRRCVVRSAIHTLAIHTKFFHGAHSVSLDAISGLLVSVSVAVCFVILCAVGVSDAGLDKGNALIVFKLSASCFTEALRDLSIIACEYVAHASMRCRSSPSVALSYPLVASCIALRAVSILGDISVEALENFFRMSADCSAAGKVEDFAMLCTHVHSSAVFCSPFRFASLMVNMFFV